MPKVRKKVGKYTVDGYLAMIRLAKRSEKTIDGYRKVLKSYADFLKIPLDKVHEHISTENLIKYADSRKGRSESGTHTNLSILHRYFTINGVEFDELENNVMKAQRREEHQDKPLELETLQKMMDLTDTHGKALIAFLISTGCRAGESAEILLSDVHGDTVTIRQEIAKGRHGGKVYLSAEAQEYLNLWLKERDEYIRIADARTKGLTSENNRYPSKPRPVNDQRLFAFSYTSMHRWWDRLYQKVDGEKGKYQSRVTLHSCRRYFRTHAVKSMPLDLVEGIMRHTGYLNSSYVRMTDEEKRSQFHDGEAALYITRHDHRVIGGKIDTLLRENEQLRKDHEWLLTQLENKGIVPTAKVVRIYDRKTGKITEIEQQIPKQ